MEKSFNKVRKELEKTGLVFDGSRLDKVDCYHERLSLGGLGGFGGVMGFYNPTDGNIHIPAVYPIGLCPLLAEREISDVIRHEFGHALADNFRKFFCGGVFKDAFGAAYGEINVFIGGDWAEGYVSRYAAKCTQEDFAETFMLYMKYKGRMPIRYRGKCPIEKKWNTVGQVISGIAALRK